MKLCFYYFLPLLLLSCNLEANSQKKEKLVLIHGFMNHRSMYPMKGIFKKNGWDILHFTYPSWSKSIQENAELLVKELQQINEDQKIHFVAFSMGGLVLKAALNHKDCPKQAKEGKIILISSPINGSKLARFLGKSKTIQKVLGKGGGKDLYSTKIGDFHKLGDFPSTARVLVISGTFGFNPVFSEKNDGKVSTKESCLQRDHYHEYVHAGHSWICKDITTINLIDRFLTENYEEDCCKNASHSFSS
ncbi:hypothetical protein K0U07_04095 [bacterium]|nr:hypothetical protein [bacterium]